MKLILIKIKYFILFFTGEYRKSTSLKLQTKLAKQNISKENITSIHLQNTYKKQWEWRDSPKFIDSPKLFKHLLNETNTVQDKVWG